MEQQFGHRDVLLEWSTITQHVNVSVKIYIHYVLAGKCGIRKVAVVIANFQSHVFMASFGVKTPAPAFVQRHQRGALASVYGIILNVNA